MDLTNVINELKKKEKFYSDKKMLEESNIPIETNMYNKNEHEATSHAVKILTDHIESSKENLTISVVSNSLIAYIRNKLSPVKNLCAMLKNREVEPYTEKNDKLNKLVDKEIEQCLISVEYLGNL